MAQRLTQAAARDRPGHCNLHPEEHQPHPPSHLLSHSQHLLDARRGRPRFWRPSFPKACQGAALGRLPKQPARQGRKDASLPGFSGSSPRPSATWGRPPCPSPPACRAAPRSHFSWAQPGAKGEQRIPASCAGHRGRPRGSLPGISSSDQPVTPALRAVMVPAGCGGDSGRRAGSVPGAAPTAGGDAGPSPTAAPSARSARLGPLLRAPRAN
jgi:hypothetical protein